MSYVEEVGLSEEVIAAKQDWERSHAAGDQAGMDAAKARADSARDRLRGLGRGDIADGMESNDTLDSARSVYNAVTGGSGGGSKAPGAGGTPKQNDELDSGSGGSGGGGGGGHVPTGPKTVKGGGGSNGGGAPSSPPTDLAGKVTKGVTDFLSGILGSLNLGVKAGAQGTGAAAGGLAVTTATMIGAVGKVAMPLLLVWGAIKIFRIALKVGGK